MSVYFIFNYNIMWGIIYRIGQFVFKSFFYANSCFVLNVCKVLIFRVLWLCIFEFEINSSFVNRLAEFLDYI